MSGIEQYDATTGLFVQEFAGAGNGVNTQFQNDLIFAPDGSLYVLTNKYDTVANLFVDGRQVVQLDGQTGDILRSIEFNAPASVGDPDHIFIGDGNLYWSDPNDGTIQRWDLETGESLGTFASGLASGGFIMGLRPQDSTSAAGNSQQRRAGGCRPRAPNPSGAPSGEIHACGGGRQPRDSGHAHVFVERFQRHRAERFWNDRLDLHVHTDWQHRYSDSHRHRRRYGIDRPGGHAGSVWHHRGRHDHAEQRQLQDQWWQHHQLRIRNGPRHRLWFGRKRFDQCRWNERLDRTSRGTDQWRQQRHVDRRTKGRRAPGRQPGWLRNFPGDGDGRSLAGQPDRRDRQRQPRRRPRQRHHGRRRRQRLLRRGSRQRRRFDRSGWVSDRRRFDRLQPGVFRHQFQPRQKPVWRRRWTARARSPSLANSKTSLAASTPTA